MGNSCGCADDGCFADRTSSASPQIACQIPTHQQRRSTSISPMTDMTLDAEERELDHFNRTQFQPSTKKVGFTAFSTLSESESDEKVADENRQSCSAQINSHSHGTLEDDAEDDAFMSLDPEGRVISYNRTALDHFGQRLKTSPLWAELFSGYCIAQVRLVAMLA